MVQSNKGSNDLHRTNRGLSPLVLVLSSCSARRKPYPQSCAEPAGLASRDHLGGMLAIGMVHEDHPQMTSRVDGFGSWLQRDTPL